VDWRDRIGADPAIMVGKPVIKGARITVEFIIQALGNGWSFTDILKEYPHIVEDDIRACLQYAHDLIKNLRGLTSLA